MAQLGLRSFLPAAIQAPIIVTFYAPDTPRYAFKSFYNAVKAHGYILYPGKLTTVETFRVGCMGQLGERGMSGARGGGRPGAGGAARRGLKRPAAPAGRNFRRG